MTPGTREMLLQRADYLIRTRGYAAFSYADLAESSGIRSASVHHHFPKKEDLASTLVTDYVARLQNALDTILFANAAAPTRLTAYAQRFLDSFQRGMLPFCAALAAEREALPAGLKKRVSDFFQIHLDWLTDVVREGLDAGDLRGDVSADRAALLLLSALEGGSLVGWALEQNEPVLSAFHDVLANILPRPA